jgi:hypothetical protein
MMLLSLPFIEQIGFERAEVVGYTTMVLAFLLIFFGVRSYRDNVAGGTIRFGRAFGVGALIALVASVCYVATWQVMYFKLTPDFAAKYQTYLLDKARAEGESEETLAARKQEFARFKALYDNPAFNAAITFIEPLPVGLVVSLITAGVLSRKRRDEAGESVDRRHVRASTGRG